MSEDWKARRRSCRGVERGVRATAKQIARKLVSFRVSLPRDGTYPVFRTPELGEGPGLCQFLRAGINHNQSPASHRARTGKPRLVNGPWPLAHYSLRTSNRHPIQQGSIHGRLVFFPSLAFFPGFLSAGRPGEGLGPVPLPSPPARRLSWGDGRTARLFSLGFWIAGNVLLLLGPFVFSSRPCQCPPSFSSWAAVIRLPGPAMVYLGFFIYEWAVADCRHGFLPVGWRAA